MKFEFSCFSRSLFGTDSIQTIRYLFQMAANTLLPIGSGHLSAAFLKNAGDISANFVCNKISKLNMKFGEFIITSFFPREERKASQKKEIRG